MVERVNWWVAGAATLVGSAAIAAGVVLAGIRRQTFSAVLIEVGAAIGLVVVLVILERNVIKRVTEAAEVAATEAADRATSELRERIVRLENLDDEQVQERDRRRSEDDSLVERLREGELTAAAVAALLHTSRISSTGRTSE
jgi:flagellar biosynthesis/type III secretory pathway M-ring protein FliF/YscJ